MSAFAALLRRLAPALFLAAALGLVLHGAAPAHAHAGAATGAAAGLAAAGEPIPSPAHSDCPGHGEQSAAKAAADGTLHQHGAPADHPCESACCGIACAVALPAQIASALLTPRLARAAPLPQAGLREGLYPDGLRRPPRTADMS